MNEALEELEELAENYRPKKLAYADENDLISEFCPAIGCGPEPVGEGGGEGCYGCDLLDDFVGKYQHLCEHDHAIKIINQLEKRLAEAEKVIEFYAEIKNWDRSVLLALDRANFCERHIDCFCTPNQYAAGKRAREYQGEYRERR